MPEANNIAYKKRRPTTMDSDITEIRRSSVVTRNDDDDVNEDTAFFRNAEEIKVFIIKSQKTYATVLFTLVAFSISLAIGGIQVTYKGEGYINRRMRLLDSNFTLGSNTTSSNATDSLLKETTSNIFLFGNIKLGIESLLTILSLSITITLYYYYRTVFLLKKVRNNYSKDTSFCQANPLFQKFILEGIICALHVPPIVSGYVHPKFQLLVFIRVYLIGRYLQQKHSLMHSQTTRCMARLGHTELTSMFLVKASFRKFPFQMMMFGYTSFVLMSTYIVWLLEERYSYFDTMWMLIVAMTTVGYGDIYPQTILGRVAVSLASLVGILFIAIFCFLASQALILSRTEKRVLAYYETKEKTRSKKVAALNVIGMWYKYYAYKDKYLTVSESDLSGYDGATPGFTTRRQKDKLSLKEKVKFARLKINMCQEISLWRMLRHDPNGPTVNQDFVIEDLKILVHNMSENIDKMFEQTKGSELSVRANGNEVCIATPSYNESESTLTTQPNNTMQMVDDDFVYERLQTPPTNTRYQEVVPTVKVKVKVKVVPREHNHYPTSKHNDVNYYPTPKNNDAVYYPTPNNNDAIHYPTPTNNDVMDYPIGNNSNVIHYPTPKNNDVIHYPTSANNDVPMMRPTPNHDRESHVYRDNSRDNNRDNMIHNHSNVPFNRTSFRNPNTAKILEEIFTDGGPDGGYYDCPPRERNIMIAFNLMKIQQNILNNAIETIYHKTKHDISDIQRRVNSFVRVTRNNSNYHSFSNYETGL